jgi:hypothetical protein
VTSPATPLARLVGLNHDVYARDPAGKVVLNRVQALMHLSAGPSRGTLEVAESKGGFAIGNPTPPGCGGTVLDFAERILYAVPPFSPVLYYLLLNDSPLAQ